MQIRHTLVALLITLFFSACTPSPIEVDSPVSTPAPNVEVTEPKIYLSIVTHNEEPLQGIYPDYVNDEAAFWESREQLVNFAQMLHEEGVAYNYQSDWNFLLAATKYDQGTPSTNNKNFLRYFSEDLGFEIDPHAHETQYNYADVAYLIEQLGVEPSHVVGGFIAYPVEDSKLEYFWDDIEGRVYDTTWTPELLWGGGTANHQNEEALWTSGIWKPKGESNFSTHDNSAPIAVIGRYKTNWMGLQELLKQDLQPGKIYTQSVFAGQKDMNEQFTEEFRKKIQQFKSNETIVWAGLTEVLHIWETTYNAEPNILKYEDRTFRN